MTVSPVSSVTPSYVQPENDPQTTAQQVEAQTKQAGESTQATHSGGKAAALEIELQQAAALQAAQQQQSMLSQG